MAKGSKGFGVGRNAKAAAAAAAQAAIEAKAKADAAIEAAKAVANAPKEVPAYTPVAFKENDIGEYRARFPEETKTLSDKRLFEIVMSTDDDMSDDAWKSLFLSSANPNTPDGDALAELALELGAKASKETGATLERLATAREDWQGGPVYTLLALRRDYDETVLDTFPIPGSEEGNNPDRFSISTLKGDKRGTKKTTFYAQFTRGTERGKYYLERIEMLDRAADKGAIKEGIPEEILEMNPDQRDTERTFCEGRLNTMTQSYKRGMELHFQLKAVNGYSENIVAEPIWIDGKSPDEVGDKAEIVRSAECIQVYVYEEGKPVSKWEHFTIGAFLKLKPLKALEQGGGFKKLTESGATKKAPTPNGSGQATPDVTIKTVDRSLGVVTEFHRWLLETMAAKDGAEYGKFLNAITKTGNEEYTTAIVELKNALVDICLNNRLDPLYIKIKTGQNASLASDVKVPAAASK